MNKSVLYYAALLLCILYSAGTLHAADDSPNPVDMYKSRIKSRAKYRFLPELNPDPFEKYLTKIIILPTDTEELFEITITPYPFASSAHSAFQSMIRTVSLAPPQPAPYAGDEFFVSSGPTIHIRTGNVIYSVVMTKEQISPSSPRLIMIVQGVEKMIKEAQAEQRADNMLFCMILAPILLPIILLAFLFWKKRRQTQLLRYHSLKMLKPQK